ncbi:Thioredoxin F, chloroplastic [Tetrabaena socialis]|uniref:Thioredoxin F, chloroplastic n=1 Tax=Tetrabaena socialis TaxID=47790 RepID=A0A2J7ZTX3_9CHLO|nr:Thioredoxin F, chloroplastic [Tetrabaena socialis]|eukprot:PNH03712.1 Thioredoxin F, chloroplastic [Tetrabaena socialis]
MSATMRVDALCSGRVARAALRPVAVAVPRRMSSARPRDSATLAAPALAAMPVTTAETAKIVHVLEADSYHEFLAQHSDKLVVTDFHAQWCGPCKMIAPMLDTMASEADQSKLIFAKFDCGATNESKKLAMALNIKALPTFHLYRDSKIIDSMTGAKVKSLQELISKHL